MASARAIRRRSSRPRSPKRLGPSANAVGSSHESYTKELWFETKKRYEFIDITASVFNNDNEFGLHADSLDWLEKQAPHEPLWRYRHNAGEGKADAHIKRHIFGREVVVAVTEGQLRFSPWEGVFHGEFDGRRSKRVLIKTIVE